MDQVEREVQEQAGLLWEVTNKTGDAFFRSLAENCSKFAGAEGVIVGEFVGGAGTRLRTIAVCLRGELVENFECQLPKDLWKSDVHLAIPILNSDIRAFFPARHPAALCDAQECIVSPLTDSSGRGLGLMMILSPRYSTGQNGGRNLLNALASRLSGELERRRADALLSGEKAVLESLVRNAPLPEVMTFLAGIVEEAGRDVLCSIFEINWATKCLRLSAAPSLSEGYRLLAENIVVGPESGPSGRAAHSKQQVIVPDINRDAFGMEYLEPASKYGIRSCWATPVLSRTGEVLGIITAYCRFLRTPLSQDQELIRKAAQLAEIAIGHQGTETRQRQSERRLRLLSENAAEIILAYDMDRRLIYANPAVEKQTGYSLEELRHRQSINWVHPEDSPKMTELWERCFQGQGYSEVECRIITKTGVTKWILSSWGPLLDENSNQIGVQGREIDITNRKLTEEQLRMTEMRLAKAQEIAHLGIFEQDLTSGTVYWSEETFRIFGVPACKEVTKELFFNCVAAEEREPVRKILQKALEEKRSYALEYRIIRPNGTDGYVHEQAEFVRDPDGNAFRLIGTVQDITQSRRLEEQLRQSQKMEAVGQLAGGVAHDFNNLLTAVIGHSELLLHKLADNYPVRQEIEEIKKAGERAALLTKQLLAFSRKQVLQPVVLDLNSMVESMSKMLRRLIREDIHLVTVPYPGLWFVKADPGQMQQVILNLVLNARDAMPDGGVLAIGLENVELNEDHQRRRVSMEPGRYVVLSVSDSGVGMDLGTQARIFEPFFTTKEKGKGTGLGLSTVYGIIKQSGGHIWLKSEPGKGATFEIYLPKVDEPFAPDSESVEAPGHGPGSRTVLLVEDDASVRNPIRRMLERSGYRVLEASHAEEALRIAAQNDAGLDLLLTDVIMPKMSGRQLAQRMSVLYPTIKVLYMSGYADDVTVRSASEEQGRDFIEKPFTSDALVRKVRQVLGDSRNGRAIPETWPDRTPE